MMVAALFVQPNGAYANVPNVDPWDEQRDATKYAGPWPVVAHPPCARWSRLAGLVQSVYGYKRGDDGGTFASALASVRRWGGVLEHPAETAAFAAHGIPRPPRRGWQRTTCGGWVTRVEQGHYGHRAQKPTWLYVHGIAEPPPLKWGRFDGAKVWVSDCKNHCRGKVVQRMSKRERSATPPAFRDLLLSMARTARAQA